MPVQKKAAPPPQKPPQRQKAGPQTQGDGGNGEGSATSKADAFDNAKAEGQVDPGKYEAIISEMLLQKPDEKGQSVRMKVEIATDGDMRGQAATQFYKIFEADESPAKGLNFLKRDLGIMGYPDVKFGDLEQVFEEIVEKNLGVLVTVKQNGQWTNVYINGLCEDNAVIEEYLTVRPAF